MSRMYKFCKIDPKTGNYVPFSHKDKSNIELTQKSSNSSKLSLVVNDQLVHPGGVEGELGNGNIVRT